MKFKINNRTWEIKEVNQRYMCDVENVEMNNDRKYYGLCCYDTQQILIWENLHDEQKRETLIHELFHCYIGVYASFSDGLTNDIDVICDLVGNSHDIIHKIVEDYFSIKEV